MTEHMIYDVKTRSITDDKKLGVSGFMSYSRLIQTLKDAGEFFEDEKLSQLQFDERGVVFVFEGRS